MYVVSLNFSAIIHLIFSSHLIFICFNFERQLQYLVNYFSIARSPCDTAFC